MTILRSYIGNTKPTWFLLKLGRLLSRKGGNSVSNEFKSKRNQVGRRRKKKIYCCFLSLPVFSDLHHHFSCLLSSRARDHSDQNEEEGKKYSFSHKKDDQISFNNDSNYVKQQLNNLKKKTTKKICFIFMSITIKIRLQKAKAAEMKEFLSRVTWQIGLFNTPSPPLFSAQSNLQVGGGAEKNPPLRWQKK